jgi:hypothetical protein
MRVTNENQIESIRGIIQWMLLNKKESLGSTFALVPSGLSLVSS